MTEPRVTSDLRYPVGRFQPVDEFDPSERAKRIDQIERAPAGFRAAVKGLGAEQLDTPYRPGGWTVRQVVHHVPDSHMNAYVRFKLALTEDGPTIKPYDEALWAELPDSRSADPDISLALLDALHERWVMVLRAMQPVDFARTLVHPESGVMTLDRMLGLYSWHGQHHAAHITELRKRMGW
ncbi:MAG TPA: bacillithiol transferase BstA [Gemmatimonadaceae bacterium]|nr:bacillithiol transferase BstA [Gemmatimonadaceae bacterium]